MTYSKYYLNQNVIDFDSVVSMTVINNSLCLESRNITPLFLFLKELSFLNTLHRIIYRSYGKRLSVKREKTQTVFKIAKHVCILEDPEMCG